jgi:hypothetical protein
MNIEQWWNGDEEGKKKKLRESFLQCHIAHHESYVKLPGLNPRPCHKKPAFIRHRYIPAP